MHDKDSGLLTDHFTKNIAKNITYQDSVCSILDFDYDDERLNFSEKKKCKKTDN